jgi:phosphoadenosine phosphosulfate reductase
MQNQLFGNLINDTITTIKEFEPTEGYYGCFSGGKDSLVIWLLAKMAGVKIDWHYSLTTIDPPELVQFIRKNYPDVHWERPAKPLLSLVPIKGFPLRQSRWCCHMYKENGGAGRMLLTGIRAEESPRRAKRKMVEICYTDKTKRFLHPIINWTKQEVWQFIKENNLPYCKLYDEGFSRLGCVLCPIQTVRKKKIDLIKFPIMANNWRKAFAKLYANRKANGSKSVDRWTNADEMFDWWISNESSVKDNSNKLLFT